MCSVAAVAATADGKGIPMVNKVILVGNLGRDPELKYTAGGQAVATLNLATSRRFKDRDGNQQEQTEWHRIVAWGRTAEVVNQYARKGRQLYVEGRLQTRQWEDRDGHKRYTTEVVADSIQLLGPRGGSSEGGGGGGGESSYAEPTEPPITDDDIPF